MDARITKSRLANLLSYDWLKIIAAILAVVLILIVFFTTIKTRARDEQIFTVYAYSTPDSVSEGDADMTLYSGADADAFSDRALANGVFSYDVLIKLFNFSYAAKHFIQVKSNNRNFLVHQYIFHYHRASFHKNNLYPCF